MPLDYVDHRQDPAAWAGELGISTEAVELYLSSEVIDLHVDTFIWHRAIGYDMTKRHGMGFTGGLGMGHCDFPRMREASVTGAMWSITTNPAVPDHRLADTFFQNLDTLRKQFRRAGDDYAVVTTHKEFLAARRADKHAAFIVVQGGQALQEDLEAIHRIPGKVLTAVTLVHLTGSKVGATSSPASAVDGKRGLTDLGREMVARLNRERIFVDLAHISPEGFWDAVEEHDKSQPLVVTHTGVKGVWEHWRNLDDDQIKAVADTGGVVGIMYQGNFLGPNTFNYTIDDILGHMEHVIAVAGEDFVSLGSDWDGLVVTPPQMRSCLELPRMVQCMLDRGWKPARVKKVMGKNFLRAFKAIRPE